MRQRLPEKASSPQDRFRKEITSALAEGVQRERMTLRLTLRDVSLLARDRTAPVDDIRYLDSVMHFLGVKVEAGGVPTSTLDRGQA